MKSTCPSGRLPVPLPQAQAPSLDGQRPDIAWSRVEGGQRPAPGQKGVGSRLIKEREALAPSFHVGLFFCPTTEKGLGMKGRWEPVQLVNFSRREKAPGDCGPIGLLPDQFDINANLAILGDRDEGEVGGVSEAEFEPAELGTQVRLAERVVNKSQGAGRDPQIAPQERTQRSVGDDKASPVALETQTRAPVPFVAREGRVEGGARFTRNVETDAPTVHFLHEPVTRIASASETTTSRGPSKLSLPCAVRTLSTRNRSPLCHRSRAVFSSYT